MYRKYIKRILDIILALFALPFLVILIIIVSPLIWFSDRGPVFYCSKRRGKFGKVFNMYKFRTMYVGAPDIRNSDNSTYSSKDDPRVTKIGRFLRETSLDEVPQIINGVKGDMSWIGPRPPIPIPGHTWDDLNEKQKLRLTVRPGITGYNQAYFRNTITRDERWDNDCYYAKNVSFILDCKIAFKTFETVLKRKNLYSTSRDIKSC
ncbi:MAG: sugar transferase [Bacteroidales bacterium]|nr:sugar transferase [Bacteroidales bacterium]